MRAICCETVLKFPAPDADSYEDSLSAARDFIIRWKEHPLIVPAVAPHAPYTTTPEILRACIDLALEFDVPLHTHLSETSQEVEQWREIYDMPVMPWVKKQGIFNTKLIAAHCVHVDEGEIHTLEHGGAGVVHNPSSNLKLASGFAPVSDMLGKGLNVGLGTDGPASNNDLDMFEEMRLATFIAKSVTKDPTALPARQVFEMATSMGARAVHLDHLIGSLEAGKRADLALVDLRTLHNYPHFQRGPSAVYSRLVYASKSSDVTDVMVNGNWLMRDRGLLTLDEASLIEAVEDHAKRIDSFLIEREESALSKLIAIGGARQEESYEVQVKLRLLDPVPVLEKLKSGELEVVRTSHYLQYDTYFSFGDPDEGRLRYREDNYVDDKGNIQRVRYRLTLTGPAAEQEYPNSVLLSRSRFIAPAKHSARFYREYFHPTNEVEIHKDRRRWLLRFGGVELFVNVDRVLKPELKDSYLEIKSRTWSRIDAERKAEKISELLTELGVSGAEAVTQEYTDLISS
jgi:5-methylthioadenosine/S-adenosylhomocysteine deaminase